MPDQQEYSQRKRKRYLGNDAGNEDDGNEAVKLHICSRRA
jgi:hypothetical protein